LRITNSAFSFQRSAFSFQLSAFSFQRSAFKANIAKMPAPIFLNY